MESSKLKNIVLLILLVTNLLLLLLLGTQRLQRHRHENQLLAAAVELLGEKGIAVDPDILPRSDFSVPLTVEQDTAGEQTAFTELLGSTTTLTQRGLVSYYTGPMGEAELRGDGSFSITFAPGVYSPEEETLERYTLSILRRIGFEGTLTAAEAESVTVLQEQAGAPIFSCQAQAVYQDGSLVSVTGRRLPGTATQTVGQESSLSLATLLNSFRAGIIESGDACGAILEATQGYLLAERSSGASQLVPVLLVVTDANSYYVNALTGALQRA